MIDKFLVLLERFVVAHELIAENSKRPEGLVTNVQVTGDAKELPVEGEDVIDTKPKKTRAKAKPAPEEDLADDEEPAPKKTRAKKGPDLGELRDEIKTMAKRLAAGDDDDSADAFDDLLDSFKVRTVTKLSDEDVPDFHEKASAVLRKLLRFEINQMAVSLKGAGAEAEEEFEALLDEYKVRTVTKLDDEDVEAFHADAKALVAKYYEVTED